MASPLLRFPSLDLIRGFVAVGRRMSITLAARDLCLTQSAVSRQVRALEQALGVTLLIRGHRSLSFTPEGERLFRSADSAILQLQAVFNSLGGDRERRSVTLTASIGVTALWLLPRLGGFQLAHPDIQLRVAADNRIMDLGSEGIDLAIRYCPESGAPAGSVRLFGERLAPVAHAALGLSTLPAGDDLARYSLLEYDDPKRPWLHWETWYDAAGRKGVEPRAMHRFNQYDQVIQAAIGGQGIALGRLELIGALLRDGALSLLSPLSAAVATGHAYWLIQAETEPREEVGQVIRWLLGETRPESFASHERLECQPRAKRV